MNQEQQFANTLEEIKRLAKNQGNCVGREQVKEAFLRHATSKMSQIFRREKEKR